MYNRIALLVFTLFYFVIFSAVSLKAQDVSKVAPKNYKVVLDNDEVRVIDDQSNPGDKAAWHSHPDMVVYVLEGGTSKSTTKDGKSKITEFKKGQTVWMNAIIHATENIGKTKIHLLLVELKKPQ
jgi:quercetin dioxygenase-like cupin family protein